MTFFPKWPSAATSQKRISSDVGDLTIERKSDLSIQRAPTTVRVSVVKTVEAKRELLKN